MFDKKFLPLLICFVVAHLSLTWAQETSYPSRAIRMVVPFEPGGSSDITARIVAQELTSTLGQSVIIDNIGGAGGSRGTETVARANADGYTLLWANVAPIAINVHLYKNLSYDPVKNFIPITLATVFPNVLVVQPGMKNETFESLLKKANNQFKTLTYGSAGNGSSTHLSSVWLNALVGAEWLHIPYKGGGPALLAVQTGQVDMYFSAVPSAIPFIKTGRVFALATTGKTRDPLLPDVPTVTESGYPQFEVLNWNGLLAPAHTNSAIIELLYRNTVKALNAPSVREKMAAQGALISPMSPAEFKTFIEKESVKWDKMVKLTKPNVD
jgi:tripartite-type tricarboxylate transporter receptor subunit TctC